MGEMYEKLLILGFSKLEGLIYIELLKNDTLNGYQLSKNLNISKSGIYQALESMYKKGYIFMLSNGTKSYVAKAPELLLEELELKFRDYADSLKEQLKKIKKIDNSIYFLNIEGDINIKNSLIKMIKNAEKEIYLNIDCSASYIINELIDASKRGVRVVVFSFNKLQHPESNIEFFHKTLKIEKNKEPGRIMLVSDLKESCIFTNVSGNMKGIISNDIVFSRIIAEHIHSDIYLSRLGKLDKDKFDKIKINTLHENMNFIK